MMALSMKVPLRVAVVQFCPKIGQVNANIARATELCQSIEPRSVDLVCLPEMIFTGYAFPNASSISPMLEDARTGPTSRFCSNLATKIGCYVIAGYPERLRPEERDMSEVEHSESASDLVGANSAVLCGPDGEVISNYRKTNLFKTDMTWAKPGTGFLTVKLPSPLRTVCLGICMDLNAQPPYDWTLEEGPYELANHCLSQKADLVILLNSWLRSQQSSDEEDTDWPTLNFWAARFHPLWRDQAATEPPSSNSEIAEDEHKTVVVVCNRTGTENDMTFAGSSACFEMKQGSGRPRLLDAMEKEEEGVRIWQFN